MSKPISLAIIGTAGRGDDGRRLAQDPYRYLDMMYRAANKVVELTGSTTLISGAAAWADSVAITLFLRSQINDDGPETPLKLFLALPATFHLDDNRFDEKGGTPPAVKFDAGRISNHYHDEFKLAAGKCFPPGWSPLSDLREAVMHPRCDADVAGGLMERNKVVATNATHCLAMTFGKGRQVKSGGTESTVHEFLKKPRHGLCYHLDLNSGSLFKDAVVDEEGIKRKKAEWLLKKQREFNANVNSQLADPF